MAESFRKAQQLHVMITHGQLPPELDDLIEDFHQTFSSDQRGTLQSDILAFSRPLSVVPPRDKAPTVLLDTVIRQLLADWAALNNHPLEKSDMSLRHQSLVLHGVIYQPRISGFSIENVFAPTLIAFGKGVPDNWHAGCVQQILSHSGETFLLVEKFEDLSPADRVYDHHRAFPFVGGRIYYQNTCQDLVLVHWKDVISHIAFTPEVASSIKKPHFLAIPLDRVRACLTLMCCLLTFSDRTR